MLPSFSVTLKGMLPPFSVKSLVCNSRNEAFLEGDSPSDMAYFRLLFLEVLVKNGILWERSH